jgi:hypothetical protein
MKTCLIALYGGTTKWIELSLRNHPTVEWLIVLANKDHVSKEGKDLSQELHDYINSLITIDQALPETTRRKYSILDIPEMESYFETMGFFRSLFQHLESQSIKNLILQSGSGPAIWQICLYQCAEEFQKITKKLFVYNKISAKEELIRVYREFNETEKNIFILLQDQEELNMSKLEQLYKAKFGKKTLSYLLKTVNRLANEHLIEEHKEGRDRLIKISQNGTKMLFNGIFLQKIKKELK